jgi:hypothetical protein
MQRFPATNPPPRTQVAMAYDERRGRVVMFGGTGYNTVLGDTWEYDGTDWKDVTPVSGPSPRGGHLLAYDRLRQRVVMYGGGDFNNNVYKEMWEWDGTSWARVMTSAVPLNQGFFAMTYDDVLGRIVVTGGYDASSNVLSDTWSFGYEPLEAVQSCSSRFDADGDGKIQCADDDCWAVCGDCGDGLCSSLESCRTCPADCAIGAAKQLPGRADEALDRQSR